jgi:hypothetical protein
MLVVFSPESLTRGLDPGQSRLSLPGREPVRATGKQVSYVSARRSIGIEAIMRTPLRRGMVLERVDQDVRVVGMDVQNRRAPMSQPVSGGIADPSLPIGQALH